MVRWDGLWRRSAADLNRSCYRGWNSRLLLCHGRSAEEAGSDSDLCLMTGTERELAYARPDTANASTVRDKAAG